MKIWIKKEMIYTLEIIFLKDQAIGTLSEFWQMKKAMTNISLDVIRRVRESIYPQPFYGMQKGTMNISQILVCLRGVDTTMPSGSCSITEAMTATLAV